MISKKIANFYASQYRSTFHFLIISRITSLKCFNELTLPAQTPSPNSVRGFETDPDSCWNDSTQKLTTIKLLSLQVYLFCQMKNYEF